MKHVHLVHTIADVRRHVRDARMSGKSVGLVPTMGALHEGHASLIQAADKACEYVVVSIFVNPTQFGPGEDFDKYPRTLDADVETCRKAGADLVFVPAASEMYMPEFSTWVNVEKVTDVLCGASRPGHFRGVATVCTKLFNIVLPDKAFFGQKDAQQVVVIKRMVVDLNMPLEIVVCPIVRESSGLAMSSRNKYLSEERRRDAEAIHKSLLRAQELIRSGVRNSLQLTSEMQVILERTPDIQIEYISIVDARNLSTLDYIDRPALIAIAVKLGSTRLIDNIIIED
jgi:pantoate--beta-alanine ligase